MLEVSTRAIKSGSTANDKTYTKLERKIEKLTDQRDAVASQIRALLNDATFNGKPINKRQAEKLMEKAEKLLEQAEELAKSDHDD